ncbi:MAG: type ISP restriction/modification enzyme, partial [Candidatus Acidiferrales bacterium]
YTAAEREAIAAGAKLLGLTENEAFEKLGGTTCDVYLNDVAYWGNVPVRVWEYTIGGYQVIKKWLSYREEKLLGRALTSEEVRYVQEMVRRIAAICLLEPALDANYRAVKENTYDWQAAIETATPGRDRNRTKAESL